MENKNCRFKNNELLRACGGDGGRHTRVHGRALLFSRVLLKRENLCKLSILALPCPR